jgi:hypothetical protein
MAKQSTNDKKAVAKVTEIQETQGEIIVSSTLMGKTERKGEPIKVRPFVTIPAMVEVHMGFWMPTGDMAGAKVDVVVRCPCYVEEISAMYMQVRTLVDKLVEKEYKRISGESDA